MRLVTVRVGPCMADGPGADRVGFQVLVLSRAETARLFDLRILGVHAAGADAGRPWRCDQAQRLVRAAAELRRRRVGGEPLVPPPEPAGDL